MDETTKTAAQALLNRIREVSSPTLIDEGQDGWRTPAAWGELWGKSRAQAQRILRQGVEAGLIETDERHVRGPRPVGRAVPVYREKQPA